MWPTQAGKIQKCISNLANKSVFGVWQPKCICCWDEGAAPAPWPTIWGAATNTFSLGATNTLSHTFPTTVSHSLSHHLACRIETISNVSPSTFLTSSSQLHLTQLILRKTNQVVFILSLPYRQSILSSHGGSIQRRVELTDTKVGDEICKLAGCDEMNPIMNW